MSLENRDIVSGYPPGQKECKKGLIPRVRANVLESLNVKVQVECGSFSAAGSSNINFTRV